MKLGQKRSLQHGQSTPSGNTEFQFKAGDLNFHSSDYEWLVITGGGKAIYKGDLFHNLILMRLYFPL